MFNLPTAYQLDILVGTLLIAQVMIIGIQLRYPKRLLYLIENTLTVLGFILIALCSFINPRQFFVMATCFCVVILMILAPILLYRKQPNSTTRFVNRSTLLFGYILLAGALSVEPLYPLSTINLIAIAVNAPSILLPGITWPMLLSNLYLSYPVFYIIGYLGALCAYWLKNKTLARRLILLPLIPLSLFAAMWLMIGIHFSLTGQFYIALTF